MILKLNRRGHAYGIVVAFATQPPPTATRPHRAQLAAGMPPADAPRCPRGARPRASGLLTSRARWPRCAAPLRATPTSLREAARLRRGGIAITPARARARRAPHAAAAPPATRSEVETMPAGAQKGADELSRRAREKRRGQTPAPSGAENQARRRREDAGAVDGDGRPQEPRRKPRRGQTPRSVVVVRTTLSAASPPPGGTRKTTAWPPLTQRLE